MRMLFLSIAALILIPAGCRQPQRSMSDAVDLQPGPVVVQGDFDDVDAVVAGILPRFHMIDLPKGTDHPAKRHFVLRTIDDQPGVLTFQLLSPGRIEIECTIGRFGNLELESRLKQALADRFLQILGDVAAPIKP